MIIISKTLLISSLYQITSQSPHLPLYSFLHLFLVGRKVHNFRVTQELDGSELTLFPHKATHLQPL